MRLRLDAHALFEQLDDALDLVELCRAVGVPARKPLRRPDQPHALDVERGVQRHQFRLVVLDGLRHGGQVAAVLAEAAEEPPHGLDAAGRGRTRSRDAFLAQ